MQKIILLVDDTAMIHRVVGRILRNFNYKMLTAENGQRGCQMAKTWKPDLIIMDVEMPVMNGYEATRLIKSDPVMARIPLIILTPLGSEEDMRKAKEAGADAFLNKPISGEDLIATINGFLNATAKGV